MKVRFSMLLANPKSVSDVFERLHFLLRFFLFGGTEADIVSRDDGCFEFIVGDVVFDEIAEHVEAVGFFGVG